MKYSLPILIFLLSSGCAKKTPNTNEAPDIIERDTDILSEEDLEALPEN